jgi:hypothetical protein
LSAPVTGFTAFLVAPMLERRIEEVARRGRVDPGLLAEVRATAALVRLASEEWQARRIAADGNAEMGSAAIGPPLGHDEIDTVEAGAMLSLTARRVRQLIASGQLEGRHVGGRWLVSRESCDLLRETRRAAS